MMMNNAVDTIIIGAGMSGLVLGKHLKEKKNENVLILEKSRGVGGRMATRRTLETKFDHGAQFYRLKKDIEPFHQEWLKEKITHEWFQSDLGQHWCSSEGMTKLAKWFGSQLKIELDKQVASIQYENGHWILKTDTEIFTAKKCVLTAPCPQALILLDKNNINYPQELKDYHYTKALIALVTTTHALDLGEHGYKEFSEGPFFSMTSQQKKGLSQLHAYTFTMSAAFSDKYFEDTNEDSLHKIKEEIIKAFPNLSATSFTGLELKKWRYCQSLKTYPQLYCPLENNLYLIGDTFGGASLLGAIRSASALAEIL